MRENLHDGIVMILLRGLSLRSWVLYIYENEKQEISREVLQRDEREAKTKEGIPRKIRFAVYQAFNGRDEAGCLQERICWDFRDFPASPR